MYPDDTNGQVKVVWRPIKANATDFYELERSTDNKQYKVWKRTQATAASEYIEVDFEPLNGWSYYRIKETLKNGKEFHTACMPVFIGMSKLRKGVQIKPVSLLSEERKPLDLTQFNGKVYVIVLRDQNGVEHFYDKAIRANKDGLFIPANGVLKPGNYVITAASADDLVGLDMKVLN